MNAPRDLELVGDGTEIQADSPEQPVAGALEAAKRFLPDVLGRGPMPARDAHDGAHPQEDANDGAHPRSPKVLNTSEVAQTKVLKRSYHEADDEADDDWRWWNDPANTPDIVVPHVDATAVYLNNCNEIVVRQQHPDYWSGDPDLIVVLAPKNARSVAAALLKLADELEPR